MVINMVDMFSSFFGCHVGDIGKVVIVLCFDLISEYAQICKKFKQLHFHGLSKGFTFYNKHQKISVIYSGIGGTQVGDTILALKDTSCKTIIYTGSVGSLKANSRVGDIVVASGLANDCDFSTYYSRATPQSFLAYSSDSDTHASILFSGYYENTVYARRFMIHTGKIYSVCSLLSETPERLKFLCTNGYDFVDLESSFAQAASDHIGKKILMLHFITDLSFHKIDLIPTKHTCVRSYMMLPVILLDFLNQYYDALLII